MTCIPQTPALRFKGFTDAWEQRKLGDCGTAYAGLSGKSKSDFGHGDARFIPYINIFANTVTDINEILPIELDPKQNTVKYGDALFTISSEVPEEVGMSSVWLSEQENVYLNSFCFGFRQNGFFDPYYLAYLLRSSTVREKLTLLAQGISRFNISKNRVMELSIATPSPQEQRRIGSFFSGIDSIIALHQRKLELLKNIKKSLLDKMFPKPGESVPEIRFAGFTDAWEQRKLGELTQRVTRKNVNMDSSLPLTISAQHGLVDQRLFFNTQVASKDMSGYYLLRKGEFAYNKSTSGDSPWGAIKRLVKYEKGCLSTLYICFTLLIGDPDFLVTYYETSRWYKAVQMVAAEGARNHGLLNISPDDFFDTRLCIPAEIEEQRRIGSFFSRIDSIIALHQRKLELFKNIKKALLDKMFV